MTDISDMLVRIQDVILKQQKARNVDDLFQLRLSRLIEEVGESSRAYRDWVNLKRITAETPEGTQYLTQNIEDQYQDLIEETVDCIISSMALFVVAGRNTMDKCNIYPDITVFNEIFERKMDKWEANIDKRKD